MTGARPSAGPQAAAQALWKTVAFRIYDIQTLEQLNVNEFAGKYFVEDKDQGQDGGSDSGAAAPTNGRSEGVRKV